MGSRFVTYTFTGAESGTQLIGVSDIPAFTGPFSFDVHVNTPAIGTYRVGVNLARGSDSMVCFAWPVWVGTGDTSSHFDSTVGLPGFTWSCFDWTYFSAAITSGGTMPPAGTEITVTVTGDFTGSTGVCIYGTQKKSGAAAVVDAAAITVGILLPNPRLWWMIPFVYAVGYGPFVLDVICGDVPPPDVELSPTDFIPDAGLSFHSAGIDKLGIKLRRLLWDKFCECQPGPSGSPSPVGPGVTNVYQPTWYESHTTNQVNNYSLAETLNLVINYITNNTAQQPALIEQSQLTTSCTPVAWEEGTVHADLLGSGRFEVSNVVGFKVEVIDRNMSEITLSGQPMYLWNMGWISILADELLLDEKRVTRSGYLWFPCGIKHATDFTYTLRDYTRCTVTELVLPASIVLEAAG